jgi:hypothetical protein
MHSIAALAAVAALAGAAVGELAGSETKARHGRGAEAGKLADAAAYRFPLGCLGSTLSSRSSERARGLAKRTNPCWHYGVYVTAVLRRVDGAWRLTLDARSNSCPNVPLPARIRAMLAACARSDSAAPSQKRHVPRRRWSRTQLDPLLF